jgi:hypothetical protein
MERGISSILMLNDDVLIEIIAVLEESFSYWADQRNYKRSLPDLKDFSMTCKRIRSLAAPIIFRKLKIAAYWESAATGLRVIQNCPVMLEHAR